MLDLLYCPLSPKTCSWSDLFAATDDVVKLVKVVTVWASNTVVPATRGRRTCVVFSDDETSLGVFALLC